MRRGGRGGVECVQDGGGGGRGRGLSGAFDATTGVQFLKKVGLKL